MGEEWWRILIVLICGVSLHSAIWEPAGDYAQIDAQLFHLLPLPMGGGKKLSLIISEMKDKFGIVYVHESRRENILSICFVFTL